MLWTVAGAKGGVGASVVAAALAIEARKASISRHVTLVDLAGDQADLLGVDAPSQGVWEWLEAGPDVDTAALSRLRVEVSDQFDLVTSGWRRPETIASDRIAHLLEALSHTKGLVIIDAGVASSDPVAPTSLVMASSDRRTVVVRACYLALRRIQRIAASLDDVVEIREAGRALTTIDIEAVVGQPVAARIPLDPRIARVIDAGLLVRRSPRSLRRAASHLLAEAELEVRDAA